MKRHENRRKLSTALMCAALLAGLPFLVACGGDSTEEEVQTVQVRVTDHQIEMPNPLPTGATQFEVTNAGSHPHSFGIIGPAGDIKLDEPLKPGESTTLEAMFLDTGTYRVYCPSDEAHGESMQIALNVRPDAPAPTEAGS
jgi:uncharacterized cupredoxin-like copper-binding protein